jgi:CelD/BcsL family acetyltransferase involved in cellulose biosynthesis
LTLTVLSNIAQLASISDEWSAFALSSPDPISPFQLPDWLLTWWRHFGSGELRAFVFRENGELVGVVPCFLHEWQERRQVTLVGTGISDYLDPVIEPSLADRIVKAVADYLEHEPWWEVCSWQDLSAGSPFRKFAGSIGFETEVSADTPCSHIEITGTFAEYWATRSKSLRQNVRRDRVRAERCGDVIFRVLKSPSERQIEHLLDLHSARWKQAGLPGMVEANASRDFLREVVQVLALGGRAVLFHLQIAGRIAAVNLAFQLHRTISSYLTGFEPEFEALGAGRILLHECIASAFTAGFCRWDFLRGDESYKSWWGAQKIPKCRIQLTR